MYSNRNSLQWGGRANLISLLALGFVFQSVVACGGASGPSLKNVGNVPVFEYLTEEDSQEALQNWKVTCSDSNNCPNTVGQLVMQVRESVGVCTGTLIAPDRVLTNSHCFDLSESGVTPATLCSQGTRIVFAENSRSGREVVECESVITKSRIKSGGDGKFLDPDYMILKLKRPVTRGFESINFSGLDDGMRLEVRKVNPNPYGGGILDVARCEVLYQTVLLPSANNALAPVHVLGGCPVIPGNSGSSIFDSKGQIRGVVFAGVQRELLTQGGLPRTLTSRLEQLMPSFAANAACISNLRAGSLPSRCFQGRTTSENSDVGGGFDLNDVSKRLERDVRSFRNDPRFGYDYRAKVSPAGASEVVYRPVCLKASADSRLSSVVQANVMIWALDFEVNERLKAQFEVRPRQTSCQFQFELSSGSTVQIRVLTPDCQVGQPGTLSSLIESWSLCP